MGKNTKIAVAAILALTIAGCSSDGETSTQPQGSTQAINPTNGSPTPTQTPAAQAPTGTQAFNNPVVPPGGVPKVTPATPNLIQPTNATERVGVVTRGRVDPFGQIIAAPVPTVPSNPPAPRRVPVVPPLPAPRVIARNPNSFVRATTPTIDIPPRRRAVISASTIPVLPRFRNKTTTNKTNIAATVRKPTKPIKIAALPPVRRSVAIGVPNKMPPVVRTPDLGPLAAPPMQPDMARAVLVTGVIQVGTEPQAIIKVPNEPTSRYVQAGQRLANGVLVKRIEMNEGSDPVVILEQYGMEVAKMVGEGAANASQPTGNAPTPVSATPSQNSVPFGAT